MSPKLLYLVCKEKNNNPIHIQWSLYYNTISFKCKQEDWIRKTIIYIHVCGQCPTQFMLPNSSRWWLVNMWFYNGKVSLIDGEPVAIILCLHVLIAHRLFINFWYLLLSRFKSIISKIFRYIFHKTTYFQNILLSSSARIWQHKLCATLTSNESRDEHVCITLCYRICNHRHIRIKIIHGSHNVLWVLTWVGRILVNFIQILKCESLQNEMTTDAKWPLRVRWANKVYLHVILSEANKNKSMYRNSKSVLILDILIIFKEYKCLKR
jgi:hypothetical protein